MYNLTTVMKVCH